MQASSNLYNSKNAVLKKGGEGMDFKNLPHIRTLLSKVQLESFQFLTAATSSYDFFHQLRFVFQVFGEKATLSSFFLGYINS